ncbi:hypothetical protein Y032_0111g224 [Ancylostoma ceylanicum]|uniref:Uncharacterized protein n=1 Tax=Ancylostoma ceylanicum TaxID=53326 RepID=A0A016TE96_9BILA|nr:hypothetical protein Y032_0111g224 [Ancylostoma ceylanicum]
MVPGWGTFTYDEEDKMGPGRSPGPKEEIAAGQSHTTEFYASKRAALGQLYCFAVSSFYLRSTNNVRFPTARIVMDVQGRRTTRALSNVNENLVKRTAAGKDAQLTRRPALKDQRNGANIPAADRAGGKPIAKATRSVAAKPTASHSLQKQEVVADRVHPEVTGIEREIQFVEYCDQVNYLYLSPLLTQLHFRGFGNPLLRTIDPFRDNTTENGLNATELKLAPCCPLRTLRLTV